MRGGKSEATSARTVSAHEEVTALRGLLSAPAQWPRRLSGGGLFPLLRLLPEIVGDDDSSDGRASLDGVADRLAIQAAEGPIWAWWRALVHAELVQRPPELVGHAHAAALRLDAEAARHGGGEDLSAEGGPRRQATAAGATGEVAIGEAREKQVERGAAAGVDDVGRRGVDDGDDVVGVERADAAPYRSVKGRFAALDRPRQGVCIERACREQRAHARRKTLALVLPQHDELWRPRVRVGARVGVGVGVEQPRCRVHDAEDGSGTRAAARSRLDLDTEFAVPAVRDGSRLVAVGRCGRRLSRAGGGGGVEEGAEVVERTAACRSRGAAAGATALHLHATGILLDAGSSSGAPGLGVANLLCIHVTVAVAVTVAVDLPLVGVVGRL
mmetsp:Transcript_25884/g.90123  ORF Transcript_25884/g.90123 Transcript_25884/m.90123 type:complete len:385 (+) Transcript_25884:330-1484(+)